MCKAYSTAVKSRNSIHKSRCRLAQVGWSRLTITLQKACTLIHERTRLGPGTVVHTGADSHATHHASPSHSTNRNRIRLIDLRALPSYVEQHILLSMPLLLWKRMWGLNKLIYGQRRPCLQLLLRWPLRRATMALSSVLSRNVRRPMTACASTPVTARPCTPVAARSSRGS